MPNIDQILDIHDQQGFERAAMELFRVQAAECRPYRDYLSLIGVDPTQVDSPARIPFLPVGLFKTHDVYCAATTPEIVFTSSSTGGAGAARHMVAYVAEYQKTFRRAFGIFYGPPAGVSIYALLPGYLEREGSSLIYMIDDLIRCGRGGGFYLRDHQSLMADMAADKGPKILFGVSYALLDLARECPTQLEECIVMETGGMKGRREEVSKEEFHATLCRAFGVEQIHSEYGMAELTSQAYSSGGNLFCAPPWMRVSVRDLNDPFEHLPAGRTGGINITDLANLHSCAFIQTQDTGIVQADGRFTVLGRADRSEIRGCNLLVQ